MSALSTFGPGLLDTTTDIKKSLRKTVKVKLAGTVTAGQTLQVDLDQTLFANKMLRMEVAASVTAGNRVASGIAVGAGVSGDVIEVTLLGYHENAVLTAGVAAGALLLQGSVAGTLIAYSVATHTGAVPIALALEAEAGGVGDVWFFDPLRLSSFMS